MTTSMTTAMRSPRTALTAEQVARLPWEDLHGVAGVQTKVLWAAGASLAGLLSFDVGAQLASHAHPNGHHHVFVQEGLCRVAGTVLGEGSYVHIPAGQAHDLAAVGATGCVVLYLYIGS